MIMKKGLICLSIIAIVVFYTLNVATASTGNYSTTFHNNIRAPATTYRWLGGAHRTAN
jgi:hypothetical protein